MLDWSITDKALRFDSNAFTMVEPTAFDLSRGIKTAISRLDDWSLRSVNAKNCITQNSIGKWLLIH